MGFNYGGQVGMRRGSLMHHAVARFLESRDPRAR